MLILLPPSETKRDGGSSDSRLNLSALSFPSLSPQRRAALAALRALCRNRAAAAIGLKLGHSQRFEIERNRSLSRSPLLPAMDRYSGVLYDALAAETLDGRARTFLDSYAVVCSALFGLVGAGDPIPAYRLSHDSRLPGVRLKALWRDANSAVLGDHQGLIIDLRSEGYVALGPVPAAAPSVYIRVVTDGPGGTLRALNHFNKKGKGEFVRALAESGEVQETVESLLEWAHRRGLRLNPGSPGELELVI